MEYIRGTKEFIKKNTCIALGKFDGLHRGHRLLLTELAKLQQQGMTSIIFTFDYHPGNLFSDKEVRLIYTEEEKRYFLEQDGPQVMISYPFTKETAEFEPEEFVERVLVNQLDAKALVVGTDYRFGRQRSGDVELLRRLSSVYGYQLVVCEKLREGEDIISSTWIRESITSGDMEQANQLLGRPFFLRGEIIHGKAIGHTIGFPTANVLAGEKKLFPPNGVYDTITTVEEIAYYGVTNVGCNPTVNGRVRDGSLLSVESHLFDCDEDLYGKMAVVEFFRFTRPERRFSSLDELKMQLEEDVANGRSFFSRIDVHA